MNQWEYNTVPLLLVPPELGDVGSIKYYYTIRQFHCIGLSSEYRTFSSKYVSILMLKCTKFQDWCWVWIKSTIFSSVCSSHDIYRTIVNTTRQDRYVLFIYSNTQICRYIKTTNKFRTTWYDERLEEICLVLEEHEPVRI